MKRFIILFIILFIISTLIASVLLQCEKDERIHWTTYTTSDGLVGNNVCTIAIDSQGNKWFGTCDYHVPDLGPDHGLDIRFAGVSKFDGTNWTNYTASDGLVSNHIYAIAIDKEGNKWFGADIRVSKFNGTTWTNYTPSDGLVTYSVYAIAINAQGNKWFGTDAGVSKLSD